jgi:hypothetical protein
MSRKKRFWWRALSLKEHEVLERLEEIRKNGPDPKLSDGAMRNMVETIQEKFPNLLLFNQEKDR